MTKNYLADVGFNALALPQEKFDPLVIFTRNRERPEQIGRLQELILPGNSPLPEPEDQGAGELEGKLSHQTEVGLTVSILKIFAKIGGGDPAKIEAKFTDARKATFNIADPILRMVSQVQLDKYIREGRHDEQSNFIVPLSEDKIYVVWAVLRSAKFEFEMEESDGQSIGLSLPELKDLFGGGLDVSHVGESSSKVTVAGKEMSFGFKAVRMLQDGLVSSGLEPMQVDRRVKSEGAAALMAEEDSVLFDEALELPEESLAP